MERYILFGGKTHPFPPLKTNLPQQQSPYPLVCAKL
jgi:hypothetical protein